MQLLQMIKELFLERGHFEVIWIRDFRFSSMKDPIEILYDNDITGWKVCCDSDNEVSSNMCNYSSEELL